MMHESSLVKALLEQVDALKRENNAERVVEIRVCVGQFSGVEPELFRLAFETMVDTSSARGAKLQMSEEALTAQCKECGQEFAIERFRFECPACDSPTVTVVQGEQLVLESVIMEQPEPVHGQADR